MSRLFDDASSEFLEVDVAPATATPLTLGCWFYADDVAVNHNLMGIFNKDEVDEWFTLIFAGAVSDKVVAQVGISGAALTSTSATINTWHYATGVFTSSTSRDVFIDGGGKGSNTDTFAPSGVNRVSVGRKGGPTPADYFSGRIAEAAIWDVALTDVEVAVLATGVSPLRVRPANLKGYWPIFGASPETDYSGQGNNLTVTGATIADHAPVAPQFGFIGMDLGGVEVAPPTGQPFRMRGMMIPGFAGGRFGRVA